MPEYALPESPINLTPRETPTGTRPVTAKTVFQQTRDPIGRIEAAGNNLQGEYWRTHWGTVSVAGLDEIEGLLVKIETAIAEVREILPLVRAKL